MSFQAGDYVEITSWDFAHHGQVTAAVPRGIHGLAVFQALKAPGLSFHTEREDTCEVESYLVRLSGLGPDGETIIAWCGPEELEHTMQRE